MRNIVILILFYSICYAQDKQYLHQICDTLCTRYFAGRGYTDCDISKKTIGVEKVRAFIIQEIRKIGAYDLKKYVLKSKQFKKRIDLKSMKFSQKLESPQIPIYTNNIYHASLNLNNQQMVLGKDFLPDNTVPSINFSGELWQYDSVHYINKQNGVVLKLESKLMFSASSNQEEITVIHLRKDALSGAKPQKIYCELHIQSNLEKVFSDNIYAFIPGQIYPDSFIVFSAHYDHLGNIDTTYFPGANDNASGVSVLLDLIKYYKKNPLPYSVAFFFFTGEEIGLVGSKYYVEHPLFDLNRIKLLINMDLMGGGSNGIMVVNGKVFTSEFQSLQDINQQLSHPITIQSRGKAQNSDHYWFTEKGVKSFFIYTLGDITAYHDIYDKPSYLKFTNYESIFELIQKWLWKMYGK